MNNPKENKQAATDHVYFSNQTLLPEVIRLLNEGHTVTLRLRGYSIVPFLRTIAIRPYYVRPAIHTSAILYWQRLPQGDMCSTALLQW